MVCLMDNTNRRAATQDRPYDPEIPHRRSIRLRQYDYAQAGAYFVTICAQNRECLFGDVTDGEMRVNNAGLMIKKWWVELNRKFPNVETDEHIVMPNHFHGIITIVNVGADPCVRPDPNVCPNHASGQTRSGQTRRSAPTETNRSGAHTGAPLPNAIQWFKTMTTNEYIRGVKTAKWPPFNGRFWQRNYYEHIIRDDDSLNHIREYIITNPAQWEFDRENPVGATRQVALPATKDEPWCV